MYYLNEIIRKQNGKWCLFSKKSGRRLGCYDSLQKAKDRERQVQYFKTKNSKVTEDELIKLLKEKKDLRYL